MSTAAAAGGSRRGAGGNVVVCGGGARPGQQRRSRGSGSGSSRGGGGLLLPLVLLLSSSLLSAAATAASPDDAPAPVPLTTCYARCAGEALGALFSSPPSSSSSGQQQQRQGGGPVCGSDGRSYATGCLAACAGASEASPGYCAGDRLRFAGAGLPLLPASLLPFERGGDGGGRGGGGEEQEEGRRNPTEALAARMALFAEEGFRYVGRTQLAPSVRRHPRVRRQPVEAAARVGAPSSPPTASTPGNSNSSSSSSSGSNDDQTTTVEVFRATPQGDLYVARYNLPVDEARRAGVASAAALYRPADPGAARQAFLERARQPARAEAAWPVVAAAARVGALVPESGRGGGGGGGQAAALERQLGALMAAPAGGAGVSSSPSEDAMLAGVKWPVVDVSACLANETAAEGGGKGGAAAAQNDYIPAPAAAAAAAAAGAPPPPPPPASRRMLRSKPSKFLATSSYPAARSLSSILGPDERRRCPLSAEPALPEPVFERAMAEARATLAAGGTVGKPANLATSSGSFTREGGERTADGARAAGGQAGNSGKKKQKEEDGTAAAPAQQQQQQLLPPHAPPPTYGARWPYSALGQLETRDDAGERVCTGALVGPDTVLTAAHCVWDDASYAFVAAPDFSPGRYRDGCRLVSPWGVVKWKHATILRAYADTWEQDVAIIKLDAPVGWRTGWLGMRASCGSEEEEGGSAGGGGAGAAGKASSAAATATTKQTLMSIAGYPLMPRRADDGECLVATCDVRLREPDAATGKCPAGADGAGGGATSPPAPSSNPLTAHGCDTAPGQSGAPLYDSDGYARAIHVLGISVGEPDNGATTLTPWVMANVARWVKGPAGGGGGAGGGVPEGEPMTRAAGGKDGRPPAPAPAGPVPEAIRSLMDGQGTLPLDKPEEWQKSFT